MLLFLSGGAGWAEAGAPAQSLSGASAAAGKAELCEGSVSQGEQHYQVTDTMVY